MRNSADSLDMDAQSLPAAAPWLRKCQLPASTFAMWIVDIERGVIVEANEAAASVYGCARARLVGRSVSDVCRVRDLAGPALAMRDRWATSFSASALHIRDDGSTFLADISVVETGVDGHTAMVLVHSPSQPKDVTEPRKEATDVTPLDSADYRADGAPTRDPISRTMLSRPRPVVGAVERANRFVSIEGREIGRMVRDRIADRASEKSVDVFFDCGSERMWVEPAAFSHALHELVDNAVRATRRGHPVLVDMRGVGDGEVLWQVHDTGVGMAARTLAELGESHPSGGIALAWAVVDMHHGLLRFESALGLGTTVSVWLAGRRCD